MTYDIANMKIGDTVSCKIHPCVDGSPRKTCDVIYIHPELRFFRVAYRVAGQEIRESYIPYGKDD